MYKLKRLRRREVPVDVHSEDEEELDITRGVLEFSDTSDSEASCEDSDVESEMSHSEGEEETQEENGNVKEEPSTREELILTSSIRKDTDTLVEEANTTSRDISDIIRSKAAKQLISVNEQKLRIEDQPEVCHGKNNSNTAAKNSDVANGVSSIDSEELQSHSEDENEAQDEKQNNAQNSIAAEMSGWQKKVLARQEYRKKLAEDPAFVPHLGEFWGHDDRFVKDELKDDFDSNYRKSTFASWSSRGKNVWENSPSRDRWDHDGFEELMKIEDEERNRKEFQRSIQQRREFVPPVSQHRSHFNNNFTHPKFNHSRHPISFRRRNSLDFEQSRPKGMFLSRYDTKNKGGNVNSNNFNYHKPSVRESRSENSYSKNASSSRSDNNKYFTGNDKSFLSKGRNGFRGRGYNSRHYLRSNLNQSHYQVDVIEMGGKQNIDHGANSKEQHLNNDDVDNKDSHEQRKSHENEFYNNVNNAVSEYQIEKDELTQNLTDITSNPFAKEGMESGSSIKEQEKVYEKSDEKSEVGNNIDSQSKKAIEDNVTYSVSPSINNVTSSFSDLSINNSQSDTVGSLPSTTDKDRVQTNQASKRYSTRRAASFSITQPIQTNDLSVSEEISNNSRTSEIPPSAVFAPPFQPRALALPDENSISTDDSTNNFLPQKPETSIPYYMEGLNNNLLSENNIQPTSIAPTPYVTTESNGMVYYYDPNMYYYYYPTHTTPELKGANDNPVKSSENDGVYYYYPVYYQ